MPRVTTVEYDGAAIRDCRENLGYTLADVSKLTGRRIPTLSDIERNRHPRVSKRMIGQLARVLEAKPEQFIKASGSDSEAA